MIHIVNKILSIFCEPEYHNCLLGVWGGNGIKFVSKLFIIKHWTDYQSVSVINLKKKSHIHVFVIFHQRLIIKKEKNFVIFDLLTFSDSFDNN